MKIEKIKPIPKYIKNKIYKLDLKRYPKQDGVVRFYSYLTKNDGELVKVTVAVKTRYKTHWYCKQVAVHGIDSERCFVKDMCFYYISGYHVGWFEEGLTQNPKWYEDSSWGWTDDKYFDPHAYLINKEYVAKLPEFKYSAANLADGDRILQYLRTYRQFPVTEYLLKLGLFRYVKGTQLLKRLITNKDFRSNKKIVSINKYNIFTHSIIQSYISRSTRCFALCIENSHIDIVMSHIPIAHNHLRIVRARI